MKQLRPIAFLLVVGCVVPSLTRADAVRGGREYVKQQKEIIQLKKQLEVDYREVEDFAGLLLEIDALRLPRRITDFWKVNTDVRDAMDREYAQAEARAGRAGSEKSTDNGPAGNQLQQSKASDGVDPTHPQAGEAQPVTDDGRGRLRRMKSVIMESHGLQYAIADGDLDVFPRYRRLLGDFLDLMREEIEAAEDEIRARQARWE